MIKNLDGLHYIKELLEKDAPTTEIVEVIDALVNQTQNFDAAIFFSLTEDFQLSVNAGGDVGTQCYGLAVHLLDTINEKLNGMVLEAESNDETPMLETVSLAD